MIRLVSLAAIVVATALSAPATAGDGPKDAPVKKEKKICVREPETGSIMTRSVCRTEQEWKDSDARNQANNEQYRGRPQSSMPTNSGN